MTFLVIANTTIKMKSGNIELKKNQAVKLPEAIAKKLIEQGKVIPASAPEKPMPEAEQSIPYELAERMAIMGENCEPEQIKPYVTDSGILVIPFASNPKYHYWKQGGQSVCDTLRELGRCDLIPRYKSNLSKN